MRALALWLLLGAGPAHAACEDWPSPTCNCEPFRAKVATNDREVCVCTRPGTRCDGKFTVETYAISAGGSDPWKTGGPPPKESTTFALPSAEVLDPSDVLLFALDKDDYVALALAHKDAPGGKRTLRPNLLFGSLASKIVTKGYEAKTAQAGAREDYDVRTNAAKRTVELWRKNKQEWAGKFNLAGARGTPTPLAAAKPQGAVKPQAAGGPPPTMRGLTENEIREHVRTSFRTTLVANGFTAEVMTINQSGRHLAFASLDRAARSVLVLHDFDAKSAKALPLPFKDAAAVGMALRGGWTKVPPSLGAPRLPATQLYVSFVSPGGRDTSGLYLYDVAAATVGPPKLVLKGSFGGLGLDPTGQELAALSRGKNPTLSVYTLSASAPTLKWTKKLTIGDAISGPAFAKDRAKIFVTGAPRTLFATANGAAGAATKVMDGLGAFAVGISGKEVLVAEKDGKLLVLDLKTKSSKPWLDCRGAACRTPTIDPERDIAYFSIEKTLSDGVRAAAIGSNGGF